MSAIIGLLNKNNEPVSVEHSRLLMNALQQFPADDIQTLFKKNMFLGCHAQWITPESIGEKLPFYDYERKLAITADAIIDNRDELFNKLQVNYSDRIKMTDSQLILLSYHKWGEEAVNHLVGDFAFLIWDENNNKLYGARDFSGSRTLYFFKDENHIAFSTTLKPLRHMPSYREELNEGWLAEFLAIPDMFNTVDLFSTVYKNLFQVPPSHYLSVTNGRVKFKRYDAISFNKKLRLNSNEEYEEAFREVFEKAVKARLRTYKTVGAHLSGGLDSGTVVSFAARALSNENKKLHTFSYIPLEGFVDWTPRGRMADESPLIKSTVNHVGNINDNFLNFEGRSPISEIGDWLEILEMPYKFFLNSYWMRGIYEQADIKNVGLLLNGARGNHTISWGTTMDYYARLLKRFRILRLNNELKHYIKHKRTGRKKTLVSIGKRAFPNIYNASNKYYFPVYINEELANKTNVFEKIRNHGIDNTGASIKSTYEERKRQFQQLFVWGNGTSSTKLSLRYKLWNRDPTNDLEVVRFCMSLPDSQYVQNGIDRSLIRRATENYLPDNIRLNNSIRGIQGADAIKRIGPNWNSLINEFHELSKESIMSELLDMNVIRNAISSVQGDPRPEHMFLPEFKILMRSLIVYRFIKNII